MPTGTPATPSKPVEAVTTPIVAEAKPKTPIVPSEYLLIYDPSQDPSVSTTAMTFMPIVEAVLADGKAQKIPEKVTIEPGLNRISPKLWEVISGCPLPHVKAAIEKQAIRLMEPWEDATTRERREIIGQCNNPDLLPEMEGWAATETNAVVKADLEKQMLSLQADRPDQYKSVRGIMANAS